jgi:NAD(P)H-hydrate epimerase
VNRVELLQRFVVTAEQMRSIEARVFAAGMPVAALMEKVAGRIADRVQAEFPLGLFPWVGVLVGPGHNGGDALVVARELHFRGYDVVLCSPCDRHKDLTTQHLDYVRSLGIPCQSDPTGLVGCDWWIDGLFGFGLERSLSGVMADVVGQINQLGQPVVSIDLPSGLHTDTGEVLGIAIRASQTLCLGLWKRGLLQESALEWVGQADLIDFDLPLADIQAVLGAAPLLQRLTPRWALAGLPLRRPATTHKYKLGHLLLICGSHTYAGAAILAALGARASGVGMVTIAVPHALKPILMAQVPEALVVACPETPTGAIAAFPASIDLESYSAIGCGCGLTRAAAVVVRAVLESDRPLLLDADGLNLLAQMGLKSLKSRGAFTLLTPHLGEFRRLFPEMPLVDRIAAVQQAAANSGAMVLLKGARVAIATPDGQTRINPSSTPALARGGSGDVLTGLLAGLLAQAMATAERSLLDVVQSGVWWHAQAGQWAAAQRTELGVDAYSLSQFLIPALGQRLREDPE